MEGLDRVGSAFLRRILLRMKELGVSQTELAKRMHVSRPYITKVLHQDVNFSFRTAARLASALRMDFFPDLREREGRNFFAGEDNRRVNDARATGADANLADGAPEQCELLA